MRYDKKYNYDYLLEKIANKYKQTTIKKDLFELSKDAYYITAFKLKRILLDGYGYFYQRDISVISEALELTDAELIKCFFTEKTQKEEK